MVSVYVEKIRGWDFVLVVLDCGRGEDGLVFGENAIGSLLEYVVWNVRNDGLLWTPLGEGEGDQIGQLNYVVFWGCDFESKG